MTANDVAVAVYRELMARQTLWKRLLRIRPPPIPENELAWMMGRILYDNAPARFPSLVDVQKQLERMCY